MSSLRGRIVFVRLSADFRDPLWRQAVVLGGVKEYLQLVVQVLHQEAEALAVSVFAVEDKKFALVEARANQVREECQSEFLELGAEEGQVLKGGRKFIASDEELTYATASETGAVSKSRRRGPKEETSEEEDSGEESELELGQVMDQMRKSWLGGGTGSGKLRREPSVKKKVKEEERHSLLAKKPAKEKRVEDLSPLQELLMKKLEKNEEPSLETLVALQLAENLAGKKKKKTKRRSKRAAKSSSSSASSLDSASEEESESGSSDVRKGRSRGHARAIADMERSRQRMFRRPLRYVKDFVSEVERELGVEDGLPYKLSDFGRRIPWGKQKSLQRCHYLVSKILEFQLKGHAEKAALMSTLTLRALAQAAMDQGDWSLAWHLTRQQDVFGRKQWGGDPESLQEVASYLKTMKELDKSARQARFSQASRQWNEDTETAWDPKRGKGTGKKQKGKEKEENPGGQQ